MLLSGAVEDLIKRKFLFADQKTSQKSNNIYNQGKYKEGFVYVSYNVVHIK